MELPVIVLFLTTIIAAFFSYLLLKTEHSRINTVFSIFSITVAAWSINLAFFLHTSDLKNALLHANFYYIAAAAIPLILFYFSYYFKRRDRKLHAMQVLFTVPFLVLAAIILFRPNFIITAIFITEWGKDVELNIMSYVIYTTYFLAYVGASYINFFTTYKKTKAGIERKQVIFVMVGLLVGYILGTVFNLFLPAFGNYQYIWVGPLGIIGVVVFIGYAIIKYKLFDLKIIATEFLITTLWLFLLVRTIIAQTQAEQITNAILLVFTIIIGSLLIRSVVREVKARERIEELAKDLKKANTRLKELDEQKSEFLSIASHQFRSPLTAIKGYVSLMLEGSLGEVPQNLKQPLERVYKSSADLAVVVEDFLNLSRIEQGRMQYEFQEAGLRDVVDQSVEELRQTAEKQGLKLNFHFDENDAYEVPMDISRIKQVVMNLVDNAIKYTPEGKIDVTLERPTKDTVRLTVKDTGVGIPIDSVDKLFHQFRRARNANKVNVRGTGLGLYVARKIVEAHKGRIWARSPGEGKGAIFFVELPLKPDLPKSVTQHMS